MRNRLPHAHAAGRYQALCGKCHTPIGLLRPVHCGMCRRVPAKLPPVLARQLARDGELLLQRTHVPGHRPVNCLRCGHEWSCATLGDVAPPRVPALS